jgi:hypothetical protein
MTANAPEPKRGHKADEAEEVVELLAGPGPVEDPGAVEDEEDVDSPVSDTDAQPPL